MGWDFIQGCLNPPSDLLPICKAGVWGWLQGAKIPSPSDFGLGDTDVARSWGVPGPAGGSPSLIPPLRGHPGAQTSRLLPHLLLQCITYCSGDLSWRFRRSQCPVKTQRENHSPRLAGEVKLQLCLVLTWPEAAVAQQGWARVGGGQVTGSKAETAHGEVMESTCVTNSPLPHHYRTLPKFQLQLPQRHSPELHIF